MIKATKEDEHAVTGILSRSFEKNRSVNYIVRQDDKRLERMRDLMKYSFRTCLDFGEVWLSEDRHCNALVLFPDRKTISFRSAWRDLKLIFIVTGIRSVFKVLKRESLIRQHYPCNHIFYIWFVGCDPDFQGAGRGTAMMHFLLDEARRMGRTVYLETSSERNIPWYQKLGFQIYGELDFGYKLYLLRKQD